MKREKQQLVIGLSYYVIAVLVVLFFYREKSIPSEFVQTTCAVLFLFIVPFLLVRQFFKEDIRQYNLPVGYIKKQLFLSVFIIWGGSLLFWGFMLQWGGGEIAKKLIWKNGQTVKLILMNLTIVPIGLLAQEFFFRGFLLKIFRDIFNKWLSVSVTALLAGVFGMILSQTIFRWQVLLGIIVLNIVLGLIVLRIKSVIATFFLYWMGIVVLSFWTLWGIGNNIL